MISVRRLTTGYNGAFHLADISFEMERGSFWGIIGPNGSGKSTLLKTLSRVLEPQGGEILLQGTSLPRLSFRELARKMAVVGSEAHFAFPFRVEDVVMMGRIPFAGRLGGFTARDHAAVESALKRTESMEFRDRYIHQLSSGERQRVLLARALAQEPAILLLDEPTAHLDLHYEIEIFRILKTLNSETGITILAVSHNLNLMAEFCERLMVMQAGRSVAQGVPAEILTPQLLHDVFRIQCEVSTNPFSRSPVILLNTGRN